MLKARQRTSRRTFSNCARILQVFSALFEGGSGEFFQECLPAKERSYVRYVP